MSKIITIIELLNKIANGEIPRKIKYEERVYVWNEKYKNYHAEYENWWLHPEYKILNNTVEILEDKETIDIDSIEELHIGEVTTDERLRINELIKAVKQINKKIEEEK